MRCVSWNERNLANRVSSHRMACLASPRSVYRDSRRAALLDD